MLCPTGQPELPGGPERLREEQLPRFLDALRLVTDSLSTTLDHALRERGGVQEVRRRSAGHPTHFTIGLDVVFGSSSGSYSLTLGARKVGAYVVQSEQCHVTSGGGRRRGALVRRRGRPLG